MCLVFVFSPPPIHDLSVSHPTPSSLVYFRLPGCRKVAAFVYPLITHLRMMARGPAKTSQADTVFATLVRASQWQLPFFAHCGIVCCSWFGFSSPAGRGRCIVAAVFVPPQVSVAW